MCPRCTPAEDASGLLDHQDVGLTGHPNDAFDTAAIIHLADYQQ